MNPERQSRIEAALTHLLDDTDANIAMLIQKSGEVIASVGQTENRDLTAIAALLAGTFASSGEVARLLKEKDFRVLFQKGIRENVFTELIGIKWLLVVISEKDTHIGLIKVLAKRATDELVRISDKKDDDEGDDDEGWGGVMAKKRGPSGGGGGPLSAADFVLLYKGDEEQA